MPKRKRKNELARVAKSPLPGVDKMLMEVGDLIGQYKLMVKQGDESARETLLDEVLLYGQKFIIGQRIYKVALGMVCSALKSTTDNDTYARLCEEKFGYTAQTCDKYALIYDAWASGEFLYTMPEDPATKKPYNWIDLNIRNLETGAGLIVEGEFTEERAHRLFGDGDWMTKKDEIRDVAPKVVKRRTKKKEKVKFRPTPDGDLWYGVGESKVKFGVLFMDDETPLVRVLASRLLEAAKKEFKQ